MIDGSAAYDVLKNFEDRWKKASKPHGMKKLKKRSDDSLLTVDRIPDIIGLDGSVCHSDTNPATWNVQVHTHATINPFCGQLFFVKCISDVLVFQILHVFTSLVACFADFSFN